MMSIRTAIFAPNRRSDLHGGPRGRYCQTQYRLLGPPCKSKRRFLRIGRIRTLIDLQEDLTDAFGFAAWWAIDVSTVKGAVQIRHLSPSACNKICAKSASF